MPVDAGRRQTRFGIHRLHPNYQLTTLARDEQRGAHRAAQVAQRREAHDRRLAVEEQMRLHRRGDARDVRVAEPDAQPAADDDRVDVEQVLRGGDAGAERGDRARHELHRHRVLRAQRAGPDAAGQPVAAALLHDLEQLRVLAVVMQAPRAGLHGGASRVGLHAAAASAGAAGAVAAHDDVADLARGPAPEPRLAAEHEAAADAGAPEDAEDGVELAGGAELELGVGRHLHVVAEPHGRADPSSEVLAQREGAFPAGQVARAGDGPVVLVDRARRADPDAGQLGGLDAGGLRGLAQRARHRLRDVSRAALGRGGLAVLAQHLAVVVDDDGLDLRAAEIDAAAHAQAFGAQAYSGRATNRGPATAWRYAAMAAASESMRTSLTRSSSFVQRSCHQTAAFRRG